MDDRLKRKVRIYQFDKERGHLDILWNAYKSGSFKIEIGLSKLHFSLLFSNILAKYQEVLIVDVAHKPVCFVGSYFDGWTYEPHVEFFTSASKRNILEASVEFFKQLSEMETIGCVLVKSLDSSRNLFDHVSRKGCLNYLGVIPKGDYRGNEHIYYASGNAIKPSAERTPTAKYWI